MKLGDLLKRIVGPARRSDITAELAHVYYLAAELSIKAQQADRKIARLRKETTTDDQ